MPDCLRNAGASVRQRLLNLAHARGQPIEPLLTRYAGAPAASPEPLAAPRAIRAEVGDLPATWFDATALMLDDPRRIAFVALPRFLGRNRLIRRPHLRLVIDDCLSICSTANINRDQAIILKCRAELKGQVVEQRLLVHRNYDLAPVLLG